MKDWNLPWEGQDSGFIWLEENGIIMCDPNCTRVDFQTEDEIKSLEYAEGIVEDGVFYVAVARIEGRYYNAD